jgi:leucyl-tRNA synthetase
MMTLVTDIYDCGSLTKDEMLTFVKLISPFAPHIAEEIWESLGGKGFCSLAEWPKYDEAKTIDSTVEVALQVNGKLKGTIMLPLNCPKDDAIAAAKADEKMKAAIEGKTIVKEIAVPNRIVNIVVK